MAEGGTTAASDDNGRAAAVDERQHVASRRRVAAGATAASSTLSAAPIASAPAITTTKHQGGGGGNGYSDGGVRFLGLTLSTDTLLFLRGLSPHENAATVLFFGAWLAVAAVSPARWATGDAIAQLQSSPNPVAAVAGPWLVRAALAVHRAWAAAIDAYGLPVMLTVGLFFTTTAQYWLHAGMLSLLDVALAHFPESALGRFAQRRKIQAGRRVALADWRKCARRVLCNQLFVNVPLGLVFLQAYAQAAHARGRCRQEGVGGHLQQLQLQPAPAPSWTDPRATWAYLAGACGASWARALPPAGQLLAHLAVFLVVEELLFYAAHRAFHWGPLYRRVHKVHHEFTAPVGLAATYAHPLEHALANVAPILLGPLVAAAHPVAVFVWVAAALGTTVHTHSGYELWGFPSARAHDFHHYAFRFQFGVLGVLDALCKTTGGDRWFAYVDAYDRRQHGEIEAAAGKDGEDGEDDASDSAGIRPADSALDISAGGTASVKGDKKEQRRASVAALAGKEE